MKVKCNGCGHVGEKSEFKTGNDMFQNSFISGCPKCCTTQSPGDASMRMFGGERPFEFVRDSEPTNTVGDTLLRAGEAS